jgi:hypothetical protein
LRFRKSADFIIGTNVAPPETGLLIGEQTCADLRPHHAQDFKTSQDITSRNADPRYSISDSGCRNLFIGLVDRKSVAHKIFSRYRRRTLITSPLHWQMNTMPVPHPVIPVLAGRGGTQLKTPRPVLLVDTREQNPFDFSRFERWFAGIEKKPLKLGDYSIAGLEDICVVERKDLPPASSAIRDWVIQLGLTLLRG